MLGPLPSLSSIHDAEKGLLSVFAFDTEIGIQNSKIFPFAIRHSTFKISAPYPSTARSKYSGTRQRQ